VIAGHHIAAEARRWLATPYVHQGRTRFGVDCVGFILCVRDAVEAWPAGMLTIRNYARVPTDGLLMDELAQHCTRISELEEGCLLAIRWPLAKHAAHLALYAGGSIIHAYQRAGCVVETGYRAHWLRDTASMWRLPGVAP